MESGPDPGSPSEPGLPWTEQTFGRWIQQRVRVGLGSGETPWDSTCSACLIPPGLRMKVTLERNTANNRKRLPVRGGLCEPWGAAGPQAKAAGHVCCDVRLSSERKLRNDLVWHHFLLLDPITCMWAFNRKRPGTLYTRLTSRLRGGLTCGGEHSREMLGVSVAREVLFSTVFLFPGFLLVPSDNPPDCTEV